MTETLIARCPLPPGDDYLLCQFITSKIFLLNEEAIFDATRGLLASKCPYKTPAEVEADLINLVLEENHLKPFAAAILDASIAKLAQDAWDAVFKGSSATTSPRLDFPKAYADARALMRASIADNTWKARCKGRDLLKSYASKHGINYIQFRNLVLTFFKTPPVPLDEIMKKILP